MPSTMCVSAKTRSYSPMPCNRSSRSPRPTVCSLSYSSGIRAKTSKTIALLEIPSGTGKTGWRCHAVCLLRQWNRACTAGLYVRHRSHRWRKSFGGNTRRANQCRLGLQRTSSISRLGVPDFWTLKSNFAFDYYHMNYDNPNSFSARAQPFVETISCSSQPRLPGPSPIGSRLQRNTTTRGISPTSRYSATPAIFSHSPSVAVSKPFHPAPPLFHDANCHTT